MKILISGSHGLIGTNLIPSLVSEDHRITSLVRQQPQSKNEIGWNPASGKLDGEQLEGFDAVIHLAGENIAAKRWNHQQKERIKNSRVHSTVLLTDTLARLKNKPHTLLVASASGFYGDRGEQQLDENSEAGKGFLAELCLEWEEASAPAAAAGIRVVNMRFGVVLSHLGGALTKMLLPFKLGAGGVLGKGQQYMPWIALDDVIAAIHHLLSAKIVNGAVNVVAPNPVQNREYTRILGNILNRPTILPVPAIALRLMFGEMADETLLASTRLIPKKLLDSGFQFKFSAIENALRYLVFKQAKGDQTEPQFV